MQKCLERNKKKHKNVDTQEKREMIKDLKYNFRYFK